MLGTETSENSSELNSEKESDVVSDTDDRQVLKGKYLSASQVPHQKAPRKQKWRMNPQGFQNVCSKN